MFLILRAENLIRRFVYQNKLFTSSFFWSLFDRSSCVFGRVSRPDGAVSVPVNPHTALPLPASETGYSAIFGGSAWTDALPQTLQNSCGVQKRKVTFSARQKFVCCIYRKQLIDWTAFADDQKHTKVHRTRFNETKQNRCKFSRESSSKTNHLATLSLVLPEGCARDYNNFHA